MTFSRGDPTLHEAVDLTSVITTCLQIFTTHDLLTVKSLLGPDLPRVWGDASQLTQVVQNLLLNAAEAVAFTGQIQVSGYTESGADGQWVATSVQDDGHGVEPENIQKLFDPYFSTKDTGTGLGLSTA